MIEESVILTSDYRYKVERSSGFREKMLVVAQWNSVHLEGLKGLGRTRIMKSTGQKV